MPRLTTSFTRTREGMVRSSAATITMIILRVCICQQINLHVSVSSSSLSLWFRPMNQSLWCNRNKSCKKNPRMRRELNLIERAFQVAKTHRKLLNLTGRASASSRISNPHMTIERTILITRSIETWWLVTKLPSIASNQLSAQTRCLVRTSRKTWCFSWSKNRKLGNKNSVIWASDSSTIQEIVNGLASPMKLFQLKTQVR